MCWLVARSREPGLLSHLGLATTSAGGGGLIRECVQDFRRPTMGRPCLRSSRQREGLSFTAPPSARPSPSQGSNQVGGQCARCGACEACVTCMLCVWCVSVCVVVYVWCGVCVCVTYSECVCDMLWVVCVCVCVMHSVCVCRVWRVPSGTSAGTWSCRPVAVDSRGRKSSPGEGRDGAVTGGDLAARP